jgi:hypothetical protein
VTAARTRLIAYMMQYGTVVDSECIHCYVRVRECPIFTFHLMGLYSYVYVETG